MRHWLTCLGICILSCDAASSPAKQPHFPGKAKHVIFLYLNGGLSQIDSFDRKVALDKFDGKPLPYEVPKTEFATMGHKRLAKDTDGPVVALIEDLKSRGLLDETLVILGSEFGRTPVVHTGGAAAVQAGRDHNTKCFTTLLAGGGIKQGKIYGTTDDFGFKIVENPVHVHDLHATILHSLGFDHERLTYKYSGRDFRLTDVHGRVVKDLLA